jgi:hypothetical protein
VERSPLPVGLHQRQPRTAGGRLQQEGGAVRQERYSSPHAGKYAFETYLSVNEKTNAQKTKKGNVSNFTKNIEANKSIYSEGPAETDHVNSIRAIEVRGVPASYDGNGIVHFWTA